jgi:hypothetical protein
MMVRLPVLIVAIVLAAGLGFGLSQWTDRAPAAAATNSAPPADAAGPPPRAADGRPDLSGVWQAESLPRDVAMKFIPGGVDGAQTLGEDVPGPHFVNVMFDMKPDEVALTPQASAIFAQRGATLGRDMPSSFCLPNGVPAMDAALVPHKIVQTPSLVLILYEEMTMFRQIFTDGRPLPESPEPSFLGHSVGRWDGDVLVVDAIGFRDNGWLDAMGHPHSGAMRVTQRFHRRTFGTMDVQVTVDDAANYVRPFTYTFTKRLRPKDEIIEAVCENEKFQAQLKAR